MQRIDNGWSRQTRGIVAILSIGFIIWLLYVSRTLIGPLVIAALLAYVLNPLVTFMNKRTKLPRSLAVTLLYLASITALIGTSVALTPMIIEQGDFLTTELNVAADEIKATLGPEYSILGITIPVGDIVDDLLAAPGTFAESDRILSLVNSATTNIVWSAIILITTFYLLLDWQLLREWMLRLAPPHYQGDARRLYERIRDIWQEYLRGTLVLMVIIGLMTGISLAIVGMPGAAALGLLTGVLDAILSIGPAIAMVIAAVFAWFQGSTYLPVSNSFFVLIVLAIYGVIQALENVWLRPRIMGSRLNMHPAVVFLAIIAALTLVGAIGALIVLPVLGTLAVIGSYVRCRVLGIDPWADGQMPEHYSRIELENAAGETVTNGAPAHGVATPPMPSAVAELHAEPTPTVMEEVTPYVDPAE